jgi:hypothetical protein
MKLNKSYEALDKKARTFCTRVSELKENEKHSLSPATPVLPKNEIYPVQAP